MNIPFCISLCLHFFSLSLFFFFISASLVLLCLSYPGSEAIWPCLSCVVKFLSWAAEALWAELHELELAPGLICLSRAVELFKLRC